MMTGHRLRDETFDGLTDEFRDLPAEQILDALVGIEDDAVGSDEDRRVRHAFQYRGWQRMLVQPESGIWHRPCLLHD